MPMKQDNKPNNKVLGFCFSDSCKTALLDHIQAVINMFVIMKSNFHNVLRISFMRVYIYIYLYVVSSFYRPHL